MDQSKVKLMLSYGGKIELNKHDFYYAGGRSRIIAISRDMKFVDIVSKVNDLCNSKTPYKLKYQLIGKELDSLVSVIDDDDVENMIFECDCIPRTADGAHPGWIRLLVFPLNQCTKVSDDDEFKFGQNNKFEGKDGWLVQL